MGYCGDLLRFGGKQKKLTLRPDSSNDRAVCDPFSPRREIRRDGYLKDYSSEATWQYLRGYLLGR